MPITNGQLLRRLSLLAHDLSEEITEISEGVWNPDYVAANGEIRADRVVEALRLQIAAIKNCK